MEKEKINITEVVNDDAEASKVDNKPELVEIEMKNESLVFFSSCHCSAGGTEF